MKKILLTLFLASSLLAHVGKIVTLRGDVIISSNNIEKKAKTNDLINEDDKIITKNNAKMQIKFIDDTIITLGKNTTLNIKDYVIDGKNSKVNLEVDSGDFKVMSGQISKIARENFALQAKTATIGIRGTVFVGKLDKKIDKIGCLEGAIDVKIGNKTSLINAGKQVSFNKHNILKIEKIKPKEYDTVKNDQINPDKKGKIDVSKDADFNNFLADKQGKFKHNELKNDNYKNYKNDNYKNYKNYNSEKIQNYHYNSKAQMSLDDIKKICNGNQYCIEGKLKGQENKNKYGNKYKGDKNQHGSNKPKP